MKNNISKNIAVILIILGILVFLYPRISNFFSQISQNEIIRNYDKSLSNISPEELEKELNKAQKYNSDLTDISFVDFVVPEEYNSLLNITNNGVIGYIRIPKINIHLPIYHGTSDVVMKNGIGHIEESSLPIGGNSTHSILTRSYWSI